MHGANNKYMRIAKLIAHMWGRNILIFVDVVLGSHSPEHDTRGLRASILCLNTHGSSTFPVKPKDIDTV